MTLLAADELDTVTNEHILVDDATGLDWTLRHGRSTALFVALKIAPERVYDVSDDRKRRVVAVLKSHLAADRVPIAQEQTLLNVFVVQQACAFDVVK